MPAPSRIQQILHNSSQKCICEGCNEPRWQFYKYCRKHAYFYRRYHHPEARSIRVYTYQDNFPRVRRIVDLNKSKQSFRMAEAFFENLANDRVLSVNSEFAHIPSMMRMSTKWDTREIIVRLGSLILLGEEEPQTFLADRHKIHQVGAHFLKYLGIGKAGYNERQQPRLYLEIGQAIWDAVGSFLLHLARTVIKADREKQDRMSQLLEKLDY